MTKQKQLELLKNFRHEIANKVMVLDATFTLFIKKKTPIKESLLKINSTIEDLREIIKDSKVLEKSFNEESSVYLDLEQMLEEEDAA